MNSTNSTITPFYTTTANFNSSTAMITNSTQTSNPNATQPSQASATVEFTTEAILKALAVAVLIIIAIAGNLVVCISFTMFRNLRSLTNYFIVSLSIADLLIASCVMPIWFGVQLRSFQWPTQKETTSFYHTMDIFLIVASVFSLTAISVERNLAITSPFNYTKWLSRCRVLIIIACIWLLALAIATIATVNPFGELTEGSVFLVLTSYFFPLLIVFTMYAQILLVARRQARRLRQDGALATDLKAIKTIAIVVGAFIVCYTPHFVVIIWYHFKLGTVAMSTLAIVRWLTYFNSCLNPIIYTCFNKTYRRAFKRLFRDVGRRLHGCRKKPGRRKTSTPRPMQRSRLSLNITMRSSAGSLLDGPKPLMNKIPPKAQSHESLQSAAPFSEIVVNEINSNSIVPKVVRNISESPEEKRGDAEPPSKLAEPEMETKNI